MAANGLESDARAGGDGFDIERDLLCTVDSDGYFTSLNSGWERVLGWTREELMSRPFIDFVHPADRERTVDELAQGDAAGLRGRELREPLPRPGRRLALAALERPLRRRDLVRGRLRRHRARRRSRRGCAASLTDEHLLAYSQPILDQRRGKVVQEELLVRMRGTTGSTAILIARPSSCRTPSAAG